MKNCDLGLENAALGLRPWAAFSRPRSQFFTIRTSQPANNIYILNMFIVTVDSSHSAHGIDWIHANSRSWSNRFTGLHSSGKEGSGQKVSGRCHIFFTATVSLL